MSALHLERLQAPYALVATVAIALVASGGSSIAGAGARSRPQPPLVTSEGRTERALLGATAGGRALSLTAQRAPGGIPAGSSTFDRAAQ